MSSLAPSRAPLRTRSDPIMSRNVLNPRSMHSNRLLPLKEIQQSSFSKNGISASVSGSLVAMVVSNSANTTAAPERSVWRRSINCIPFFLVTLFTIRSLVLEQTLQGTMSTFSQNPDARDSDDSQIVDIISVGSLLKDSFQEAQQRTFGSHNVVRHFYRITEMSDTDRTCFNELTTDQIDEIIDYCGVTKRQSSISKMFRKILFSPKKHAGWICAQKRPIDGMFEVLQKYSGEEAITLPDYLFIIDDDTYVNMDSVLTILRRDFPPDQPHLLAGCNLSIFLFTFPYGGFGSYLPRAVIQRLLQPIDCSVLLGGNTTHQDDFVRLACWRLEQDIMGEKQFFENGMSVIDLMYQFAAKQPYSDVRNWKAGYCFHR